MMNNVTEKRACWNVGNHGYFPNAYELSAHDLWMMILSSEQVFPFHQTHTSTEQMVYFTHPMMGDEGPGRFTE